MIPALFSKPSRNDVPRIIGHRGAKGLAPENTLASFREAHRVGCQWVEFDCMLTKDQEIVVHHDDALDRTTDGAGLVSDHTCERIKRLDAGSWFNARYAAARVPTLEAVFGLLQETGLGANIEIKPVTGHEIETGRIVAQFTKDFWPRNLPAPVVSSFSLDALTVAVKLAPDLDYAILWEHVPGNWADHHRRLNARAAHCDADHLTEAQTRAFLEVGIPVRAYTVNEPTRAEVLFDWGVTSIFTDYPDRFS